MARSHGRRLRVPVWLSSITSTRFHMAMAAKHPEMCFRRLACWTASAGLRSSAHIESDAAARQHGVRWAGAAVESGRWTPRGPGGRPSRRLSEMLRNSSPVEKRRRLSTSSWRTSFHCLPPQICTGSETLGLVRLEVRAPSCKASALKDCAAGRLDRRAGGACTRR